MLHRLSELKDKLDALIENAKHVGLRIDFKKTKLMRVETTNQNALSTICNNSKEITEHVEQFCYLGSAITKNGGGETDFSSRINRAVSTGLNRIWAASNISIKITFDLQSDR